MEIDTVFLSLYKLKQLVEYSTSDNKEQEGQAIWRTAFLLQSFCILANTQTFLSFTLKLSVQYINDLTGICLPNFVGISDHSPTFIFKGFVLAAK